nr:hypothetical protein [Tanacetum cinerariifolium]
CQPDNQNVDFSGSDQIQTLQYPDVNPSSPEISNEEIFQAKGDLMKSIQTFLEKFNCIPIRRKTTNLIPSLGNLFSIQYSQPKDSNELFQKLLKDLKKLAEYDQSTSTDHRILLNDNEDHPVQNRESPENSFEEIVVSNPDQEKKPEATTYTELSSTKDIHPLAVQESPHDSDIFFTTFSNPLFKDNDDLDSSNDESLPDKDVLAKEFKVYSNSLFDNDEISSDKLDPHCFNVESDFGESFLNRDTFIDFSSKFDFSGELTHIQPEIPKSDFDFEEEIRLIENLLYDNSFPRPPEELNAEIADIIIESIPLLPILVQDDNSQQEEIDIVIKIDDVMPPSVENDDDDYDLLLEEVNLFLYDNSIPSGIENVTDNPEGDIHFIEELLIDNSILSHESSDSNFEDNPSISQPPPEPPNDNFDLEAELIQAVMEDIDEPDEHFNPGGENFVFTNIEDIDYFPFMIVIRIFLPYLILPEISPLLLSAESEDMIFDPGIFD